jgi:hypothetical protein
LPDAPCVHNLAVQSNVPPERAGSSPEPAMALPRVEGERRRWSAAVGRSERLRVGDLPPIDRLLVIALLLPLVASAALLVAVALGARLPGGEVLVPGKLIGQSVPVPVPVLPAILFYLGGAVIAAALVRVAGRSPSGGALRLAVGLVAVFLAIRTVQLVQVRLPPLTENPFREALVLAGLVVAAAAAAGAVLPTRVPLWVRAPLLVLPFFFPLAVMALGAIIATPDDVPTALLTRSLPGQDTAGVDVGAALAFVTLVYLGPTVLFPYVLWQAAAWARATRREMGIEVAGRFMARFGWALPVLLAAKCLWLLAGYAAVLPGVLGGGRPVWASSLGDGLAGWLFAGVLAAAAGAWLLRRDRVRVDEDRLGLPTLFAVVGFSVASVVALVLFYAAVITVTAGAPFAAPIISLAGSASEAVLPSQVATVLVAAVLGILLLAVRGPVTTALFFIVFAVWALPRALAIAFVPRTAPVPLTIETATLDAAVTILVAILAAFWYAGGQRRAAPLALGLILVVSTLLAHAPTLIPPAAGPAMTVMALLFPAGYLLLFNASALNGSGSDRPARVLVGLGVLALTLVVITTGLAFGGTPGLAGDLGSLLFAVPFTVLLVAASISRTDPASPYALHAPRRSPRGAALAAVVLVAVGAATLLTAGPAASGGEPPDASTWPRPASGALPITDSEGYAAAELEYWFEQQIVPAVTTLGALDAAIGSTPGEVSDRGAARLAAADLERLVALRGAWLIPDAEAACALDARERHEQLEAALAGLATAAADHAEAPSASTESILGEADAVFASAAEAYGPALEGGIASCPGTDAFSQRAP